MTATSRGTAPCTPTSWSWSFAVNDEGDETKGLCYESLVKRIWDEPGKPAVLMLFSVFADDWNLKARLAPIGFRHEIPMVDVLEAVSPQFVPAAGERPVITRRQYFYDVFHPSNNGHRVMADSLLYMIERLDRQQLMEEPKARARLLRFRLCGAALV